MIQLQIDNSTCKIQGLSLPQFNQLRELLSYKTSARNYTVKQMLFNKKYLLSKRCEFPTGLLYLVIRFLKETQILYRTLDLRTPWRPQERLFNASLPHPSYPEQKAAAEAAGGLKRGIVVAPTGLGKSVIAALIIAELKVPTLVVVPRLELKRQLMQTLSEIFGNEKVGSGRPIDVQNVDSLDPNKVVTDRGCVIIDEFHHSGAATYQKLNKKAWSKIYSKIGLTATPFRADEDERLLLESVLSQVIYRVNYREAVDKGYIVPFDVYYYDLPKQQMKGNSNNWASVYSELIVNNKIRNELIVDLMKRLHASKCSTLTLVKEVAHGETLSALSGAAFAHGQAEDCKDLIGWFSSAKLRSLIATTGVAGEGVDTKAAEFILLAAGGKSKNQFMQNVGRCFRRFEGKERGSVIMFRDPSHKFLLKHFNACVRYLRDEYGIVPIKLTLS